MLDDGARRRCWTGGGGPRSSRRRRAKRGRPATTTKPSRAGMGTITGRNAPITHNSWNRVSKRGERAAEVRVGRVALHDRVERESARARADADDERAARGAEQPALSRARQTADSRRRTACRPGSAPRRAAGAAAARRAAPSSAPATLATSTTPKCHAGAVGGWPVPTDREAGSVTGGAADGEPDGHRRVVAATLEVEREQEREEPDRCPAAGPSPRRRARSRRRAARLSSACRAGPARRPTAPAGWRAPTRCPTVDRREHERALGPEQLDATPRPGAPTANPITPESSDRRELARTSSDSSADHGRHERGLADAVAPCRARARGTPRGTGTGRRRG